MGNIRSRDIMAIAHKKHVTDTCALKLGNISNGQACSSQVPDLPWGAPLKILC
jgi:hypothetical protein